MLIEWLKVLKQQIWQIHIFFLEFKASLIHSAKNNLDIIETKLLVLSHALEKGMAMKNVKKGYGQEKVMILLVLLEQCRTMDIDRKRFSYIETLAVLRKYIEYQKNDGVDVGKIEERYYNIINSENPEILACADNYLAGARIISYEELTNVGNTIESFTSSRHTVRSFSNQNILLDDLKGAIRIANTAPSACNRQPTKVYYACNDEIRKKIDELITGNAGFKGELHNYLIVTCDRSKFQFVEEFQWYVNGGIYLSYLCLGLHAYKMGSCIMQWFPFHKNEKEVKQLLKIKNTEAIIAIVGFGYYKNENMCLYAQRKDVNDVLTII